MADINTRLQELADELEQMRRKLEEANRFGTRLIAIASHEMKTPLAVIKGYATLLREGLCGVIDEKAKETLGKIETTTDDLVETVTNMVDLRKVEEGKMEYEFSKTDLVGLAKDVVEGLRPLADVQEIDLTFSASARDIFVNADPRELKHAIRNLIDNAIKYTPEGFVGVRVEEKDGEAVFMVKDSGIGFDPGVNPLNFREYVRDKRVRNEIMGSGIGSHITKSIIEAHGGKISAESEGEGKGSTFRFSLPKVG